MITWSSCAQGAIGYPTISLRGVTTQKTAAI